MNLLRKRRPHVEVFEDVGGGWRFRVVAGNGEITETSESYTRRQSVFRAVGRDFPTLEIRERAR